MKKVCQLENGTRFRSGSKVYVLLQCSGISSALVREDTATSKVDEFVPGRFYRIAATAEVDEVFETLDPDEVKEDFDKIMSSGSTRRVRADSRDTTSAGLVERDKKKRKEVKAGVKAGVKN